MREARPLAAITVIGVNQRRIGKVSLGMAEENTLATGQPTNGQPDVCGREIGGDPAATDYSTEMPDGVIVMTVVFRGTVDRVGASGSWQVPELSVSTGDQMPGVANRLRDQGWDAEILAPSEAFDGGQITASRGVSTFAILPDGNNSAESIWLPGLQYCD